jgi:hypothetical protein
MTIQQAAATLGVSTDEFCGYIRVFRYFEQLEGFDPENITLADLAWFEANFPDVLDASRKAQEVLIR